MINIPRSLQLISTISYQIGNFETCQQKVQIHWNRQFWAALSDSLHLYTWTIWIIRYRSLEILYYNLRFEPTSTTTTPPSQNLGFSKLQQIFRPWIILLIQVNPKKVYSRELKKYLRQGSNPRRLRQLRLAFKRHLPNQLRHYAPQKRSFMKQC